VQRQKERSPLLRKAPPTEDEVKQINLGTDDEPRPIFINAHLAPEEVMQYTQLLQEFRDVFAFRYAEMPGKKYVAVHELKIREDAKQVKQAQSYLRPPSTHGKDRERGAFATSALLGRNSTRTGLQILSPSLKRTGRLPKTLKPKVKVA